MPNDQAIPDLQIVLNDVRERLRTLIRKQNQINGELRDELLEVKDRLTLIEKNWE